MTWRIIGMFTGLAFLAIPAYAGSIDCNCSKGAVLKFSDGGSYKGSYQVGMRRYNGTAVDSAGNIGAPFTQLQVKCSLPEKDLKEFGSKFATCEAIGSGTTLKGSVSLAYSAIRNGKINESRRKFYVCRAANNAVQAWMRTKMPNTPMICSHR